MAAKRGRTITSYGQAFPSVSGSSGVREIVVGITTVKFKSTAKTIKFLTTVKDVLDKTFRKDPDIQ